MEGLPSFQDKYGKLITQEYYKFLITQMVMNHSNFEDIQKNLKGEVIVNKLLDDYELVNKFKAVKMKISLITYSLVVELEVLNELMESDFPLGSQWKEIERLGK